MTRTDASDRFARIESLYDAASRRPTAERAAFLADACADDETIRRGVEALLAEPTAGSHVLAGTEGAARAPAPCGASASHGTLDGQSFLMVEADPRAKPSTINVIVNWSAELARLVPKKP